LSLVVDSSGSYSVVVYNEKGCKFQSDTVYVYIDPLLQNPDINVSGDTIFCEGDSVVLSVNNNYEFYTWSNGLSGNTIIAKTTGYYDVSLQDSNGCVFQTDSVLVAVLINPLQPSITQYGDSLVASIGNTYQWYLNGSELTGETNAYIIATDTGNYSVSAIHVNGCTTLSDSLNYTASFIKDPVFTELVIYPNPVNGTLYIVAEQTESNLSLKLMGINGQLIQSVKIDRGISKVQKMDLNNTAPGIYYLHILADGKQSIRKIVVH